MDAREKLNEFAELRGWDKNKLIGWSEAADFGEWLVKNCSIPTIVGRSEQLPCPHCGQLEPCAGNSPETCYHPKVC